MLESSGERDDGGGGDLREKDGERDRWIDAGYTRRSGWVGGAKGCGGERQPAAGTDVHSMCSEGPGHCHRGRRRDRGAALALAVCSNAYGTRKGAKAYGKITAIPKEAGYQGLFARRAGALEEEPEAAGWAAGRCGGGGSGVEGGKGTLNPSRRAIPEGGIRAHRHYAKALVSAFRCKSLPKLKLCVLRRGPYDDVLDSPRYDFTECAVIAKEDFRCL